MISIASIIAAGTIHVLVVGEHAEIPAYSLFFVALGILQLTVGCLLVIAGRSISVYVIAILSTISSLVIYAVSRASPFPSLIESEAIEPIGLFTKSMESIFLLLMLTSFFQRRTGALQGRLALSRRVISHLASITIIGMVIGASAFAALGSPFVLASFYGLNLNAKWSYDAGPGAIIATPLVLSGDILYFGTIQAPSSQYFLSALNSSAGSVIWRHSTNGLCTCSIPAVYNNTLYIVMVDLSLNRESLRRFDAASGLAEWNFSTVGNGSYLEKLQTPQIWREIVFALLEGDHLYAIDSTNGKLLWEYGHGQPGLAPFAVDRGLVLLGSRYENYFYALNATNGSVIWRVQTDSPFLGQPLTHEGTAYAVSAKGTVYAFDEVSGDVSWNYSSDIGADEPPVINDSILYVRGMTGHGVTDTKRVTPESSIIALNAQNGGLLWSTHDNGLGMSKVAIAEGIVYSGTVYGYGSIYMYDAEHGWFAGIIPLSGNVAWPPLAVNKTLYFGTNEGKIYALETHASGILLT